MSYLILPSNSSKDIYPENSQSCYRVQLPHSIELQGKWEVGLTEVQYTHSWYNVREKMLFKIDINDNELNHQKRKFYLHEGYYQSIEKICSTLNETIKKEMNLQENHFDFNPLNEKVTIVIEPLSGLKLTVSKNLCELLGFQSRWGMRTFTETKTAERTADLNQGVYALFVYCDIVEPHIVGDVKVPLLRILPIDSQEKGTVVTKTYEHIQYFPVSKNRFSSVEINIKDDMDENLSFQKGKSVVTLHLRKAE